MAQPAARPAGFQSTTAQTHDLILGFHPQARPNADLRPRPVPTPETQELYDTMKQMEHELDLDERIRVQGGHDIDHGPGDLLEPLAAPSLTTMSRSPSVRSRTQSATHSAAPVDIAEVVELEERMGTARRRAVRHGPLGKYTKARAALLRKLGACESCRERKVKCTHHDLAQFERNYICSRQLQLGPQLLSPPSNFLSTPSQLAHQPLSSNTEAFLHIGGHIAGASPGVLQCPGPNEQDGPAAELERMLQAMARDSGSLAMAPSPAPLYGDLYHEAPLSREAPLLHGEARQSRVLAPWSPPAVAGFGLAMTAPGVRFIEPSDHLLPICRLVGAEWECQWSDGSDSSETGSEAEVCGLRHYRLSNLSTHFRSAHADFREGDAPLFFWICTKCRLKWIEDADECPQENCSGRKTFERWYFGQIVVPPTRTSPSSVRVSSHNGSPVRPGPGLGGAPISGPSTASTSASSGSVNQASGSWSGSALQYLGGMSRTARPDLAQAATPDIAPDLVFYKWSLQSLHLGSAVSHGMARRFLGLFCVLRSFYLAWDNVKSHAVLDMAAGLPVFGPGIHRASLYALPCAAVGLVAVGLYQQASFLSNRTARAAYVGVSTCVHEPSSSPGSLTPPPPANSLLGTMGVAAS